MDDTDQFLRYSDEESMVTYNETGEVDFIDLFTELDEAYSTFEQNAGIILSEGLLDYSARSGLRLAKWQPRKDPQKGAVEWFYFDWEFVHTMEPSRRGRTC